MLPLQCGNSKNFRWGGVTSPPQTSPQTQTRLSWPPAGTGHVGCGTRSGSLPEAIRDPPWLPSPQRSANSPGETSVIVQASGPRSVISPVLLGVGVTVDTWLALRHLFKCWHI